MTAAKMLPSVCTHWKTHLASFRIGPRILPSSICLKNVKIFERVIGHPQTLGSLWQRRHLSFPLKGDLLYMRQKQFRGSIWSYSCQCWPMGTRMVEKHFRRIDSIPCRSKEMDEKKNGHLAEWMLRKNGWSSGSHHTKPPCSQNGCSSKTFSLIHPCY